MTCHICYLYKNFKIILWIERDKVVTAGALTQKAGGMAIVRTEA
jgi:hypothetical protein